MEVFGWTITKASRQSKKRARASIDAGGAGAALRGRT
jgi:hypothetical protein